MASAGGIVVTIAGVATGAGQAQAVLVDSLTINDRLNEEPNTCTATIRGTKPHEGDEVIIRLDLDEERGAVPLGAGLQYLAGGYLGSYGTGTAEASAAATARLFAGIILRTTQVYAADNPKYPLYHLEATDYTWLLRGNIISWRYTNQSASAIAADIIARWAPGFVGDIEAGLPVLDELTFTQATVMDALIQVAHRIGGIVYCDYTKVVHVAAATTQIGPPPAALVASHPSLSHVSYVRDYTQVITRAIVEGGGSEALGDVDPGSPALPVTVPAWYAPGGGYVRSGPQRIRYTGVDAGGMGAAAGSGVTPTTAPTATVTSGTAAVDLGAHSYAYTWVTSAGETLPSPALAVTLGSRAPVPTPMLAIGESGGMVQNFSIGEWCEYAIAFDYSPVKGSQTAVGPVSATQGIYLTWWLAGDGVTRYANAPYLPGYTGFLDPGWTFVNWYRKLPNGSYYLVRSDTTPAAGAVNVIGVTDIQSNPGAFPAHPDYIAGTAVRSRLTLTGIAPGPSGTTSRKIYRTPLASVQLKLHSTIANNSATSLPSYDNVADAALGANAPTTDTAGLVLTAKQIPAGSTTILVTSVAPFSATGGYVVIGNQVVRYSGISADSLTGVPASGTGMLAQSVAYGTPITAAPALIGIPTSGTGSIVFPIGRGDPVSIIVIVDDLPAQAALAAALGGDGVREGLLVDGRIGLEEAASRGRALLVKQSTVLETLQHRSRDVGTRSGSLVTIDLPPPTDIHGTFRIQDVAISTFNARGIVPPTIDAKSATSRTTFDDFLRTLADTAPPPATGETL